MAYAQLAGLPPYYGLYASLLPPTIAALFGSSYQLATGPVAVVSLMTSAALAPLATAGGEAFIAYAIVLALLVGIFQFALGLLRLGLLVNFLSHPVVNGFTNAAALVIATSQLSKLFGVEVETGEHHYETVLRVIQAAAHHIHWPSLGLASLAFVIMISLRWVGPRVPTVLAAVLLTTAVSWLVGFEHNQIVSLTEIGSEGTQKVIHEYNKTLEEINQIMEKRVELTAVAKTAETDHGAHSYQSIEANAELAKVVVNAELLELRAAKLRERLRSLSFVGIERGDGSTIFYPKDEMLPAEQEVEGTWRLEIGKRSVDEDSLTMVGGGAVVGTIPSGLPAISLPCLELSTIFELFPMAVVISMLGFMEAISIAKRMAAVTGQSIDPNQELIGQGLGNIVGCFFQSYPVSGSFSRSAVNLQAGARTGTSMIFSSLVVLVTLLFFTPLLYHLPLAVLAAIIMMAVFSLINVRGFIHAWKAQRYDGMISVVTFVTTLVFAPHLEDGIIIGILLSTGSYLYRTMRPNWGLLSRARDGQYREATRWKLGKCRHVAVIAFNNSLVFASVNHLEDALEQVVTSMSELQHILIVGYGINELDASGEVTLSILVSRLRLRGLDISFCGVNDHVLAVMKRTELFRKIGADHFYDSVSDAVLAIHKGSCVQTPGATCPLINPESAGPEEITYGAESEIAT
jgi:MFS superfamily sulfate permease-like transporter